MSLLSKSRGPCTPVPACTLASGGCGAAPGCLLPGVEPRGSSPCRLSHGAPWESCAGRPPRGTALGPGVQPRTKPTTLRSREGDRQGRSKEPRLNGDQHCVGTALGTGVLSGDPPSKVVKQEPRGRAGTRTVWACTFREQQEGLRPVGLSQQVPPRASASRLLGCPSRPGQALGRSRPPGP